LLPHPGRFFTRSIFINYRRNDSEGEAGRLFDELTLQFSGNQVFMDVAAIEPGRDFRKAIDQSISSCSVLLAVIGPEWLESRDADGRRRLDDPNDFVRIELASALHRDIPVIPVLVRSAKMPHADQLPDDLRDLAFRNAVELTHARWKSDVQVLVQALRPYLDEPAAAATRTNGAAAFPEPPAAAPALSATGRTPAAAISVEAQTVERVSRMLAAYIGPIADVVVKRAARRCDSAESLYALVAREIKVDADRARFLKACRM
jgi:hypothetical protein